MRFKITLLIIVSIIIGAVFGMIIQWYHAEQVPMTSETIEVRQNDLSSSSTILYHFIDPLLACDVISSKNASQLDSLKATINDLIGSKISTGEARSVSVYFDDRRGRGFSINPSERYFPASMMKVPLMIAILASAENNPSLLKKQVLYDGSYDLNKIEYFKPGKTLVAGTKYTVDDLLIYMIGYSDNNTVPLLTDVISSKNLSDVFSDLGIALPQSEDASLADFMTIKTYANLFRILYNASYLSRSMSEKALQLLALPDFPDGLQSGLPRRNIKIANKFGERNFSNNPNDPVSQKELHDCGIVYFPNHPYLLCVMTKGTNFMSLANIMKEMSNLIYKFVDQQSKNNDTSFKR